MTSLLNIRNPLSDQHFVSLTQNDKIDELWNSFTCLINYNPRLYRRDYFDTRIRKDKLNDSTSKQGWILVRITVKNGRTKLIPINIRKIKKLSQLSCRYEFEFYPFTTD